MSGLNNSVRFIKGVGEARAKSLEKLEIFTLRDLVSYFPRDYEDRSAIREVNDIQDGDNACIRAVVISTPTLSRVRRGMELVRFRAADESGTVSVTFFNQSYVKRNILRGETYVFYGKFTRSAGKTELTNPVFEKTDAEKKNTGRIVPIYRLTSGISRNFLSAAIERGLEECGGNVPTYLPDNIADKYGFTDAESAYRDIHFPAAMEDAHRARERLVFEELFVLACALGSMKNRARERADKVLKKADPGVFYTSLPFEPTGAQKRAVSEALADMSSGRAMNRLVQGDVGSGKTLVAAACIWAAARSGFQSALMAPTELLADQHYASVGRMLSPFGIRTVLLKGSMTAKQKREICELLASGEADLVVGTHAILSEGVEFKALALAITDEQHRFGVRQRSALAEKTKNPHVLVMSATPIPRTLALIIYGDLDVSVINELPPGRKPVETYAVGEDKRTRLNGFIRKTVGEGRQVYVVCPMIEESMENDLHCAEELYEKMKTETFPDLRVALLHGRMRAAEKAETMRAFAAGETDILISTTVIEVGVDVPNAALMVVENAERFGLSQLHQLRGRVGRGAEKSCCVLVRGSRGAVSDERLRIMTRLNDGFRLSEEDLRLRGPGDFFGSRQHGLPEMKLASLTDSVDVLAAAQKEAEELLETDPGLCAHPALKEKIEMMFSEKTN